MRTIDVIRKAKDIYMSGKEKCMCWAFHEVINTGWAYEIEYIKENIPLFCYSVAVGGFGADGVEDGYWWDISDRDARIKYFDWLIEKYSMQSDSECEQNPHGV